MSYSDIDEIENLPELTENLQYLIMPKSNHNTHDNDCETEIDQNNRLKQQKEKLRAQLAQFGGAAEEAENGQGKEDKAFQKGCDNIMNKKMPTMDERNASQWVDGLKQILKAQGFNSMLSNNEDRQSTVTKDMSEKAEQIELFIIAASLTAEMNTRFPQQLSETPVREVVQIIF